MKTKIYPLHQHKGLATNVISEPGSVNYITEFINYP